MLARQVRDLGLTQVAIIVDRCSIGEQFAAGFVQGADRFGVEITMTERTWPVTDDLSDTVARLRRFGPPALVYLGLGLSAEPLARALRDQAWSLPVLATSAGMWGHVRPDYATLWEGWIYSDVYSDAKPSMAALHQRLNRDRIRPNAASFYDMAVLVLHAVAKAAPLSRRGVRAALEQLKMLPTVCGGPGTVMGFGVYDHAALKGEYLVMRQWRDGRSVEVERGR
jgi:ABC-type branched-subunit amino acid transport system substrate-binding protein